MHFRVATPAALHYGSTLHCSTAAWQNGSKAESESAPQCSYYKYILIYWILVYSKSTLG